MPSINNLSPYANISTAISPIDTSIIQFSDKDSKTILTITPEGLIEIGEGYTPTEAGDEFIDRLSMYLPNALEQKFKPEIDSLNAELKRLTHDNEVLKRQLNEKQFQLECWVEDYYRMQNQQ